MNEEIDQLIRSHAGPVIVQLGEPFFDAELRMDWIADAMRQWQANARVVRVELSLHREWARKHRVYGSPCTLVFQEGQLRIRVRGRCGRARLRSLLEAAGLLGPGTGVSDAR